MTATRSVLWLVVVGCAPTPTDSGQPSCPSTPIVSGSAGEYVICAIHEDGCLECDVWDPQTYPPEDTGWAHETYWVDHGQGDLPGGSFVALSVSSGGLNQSVEGLPHRGFPQQGICAIDSADLTECWGYPYDEPDAYSGWVNPPETPMVSVAQGYRHACGLDAEGAVRCWGTCLSGACDAPDGVFTAVVSGDDYSCALAATGDVQCWGWQEETYGTWGCSPWTLESECGVENRSVIDGWAYGHAYVSLAATPMSVCGSGADGTASCLHYYYAALQEYTGGWSAQSWWPVWGAHTSVEGVCGLDAAGLLTCSIPNVREDYAATIRHLEGSPFRRMFSGYGSLCGITEAGELACATNDATHDGTLSCPFCTELYQGE